MGKNIESDAVLVLLHRGVIFGGKSSRGRRRMSTLSEARDHSEYFRHATPTRRQLVSRKFVTSTESPIFCSIPSRVATAS